MAQSNIAVSNKRFTLRSSLAMVIVFVLCITAHSNVHGELIVNGDFEVVEPTSGGAPTSFGDWKGDFSGIVMAQNGITPFGTSMLHFINTGPGDNQAGSPVSSQVLQLIDVSSFSSLIAGGNARACASALFNRVAGDSQTDTQFDLFVSAYSGLPSDFTFALPPIDTTKVTIFSDGDTVTWEKVSLAFDIPINTDYLMVKVGPQENIFNDEIDPEFDGHYGDNVMLEIKNTLIPEPSTFTLALMGIVMLSCYGRRRRRR